MIPDSNGPSTHIVLATADALGSNPIMKRTGTSKPSVWRWQERYLEEVWMGYCATRRKPLSTAVKRKVLSKTASELPPNATHWNVRSMTRAAASRRTHHPNGTHEYVAIPFS
jgi:hypothetical protein